MSTENNSTKNKYDNIEVTTAKKLDEKVTTELRKIFGESVEITQIIDKEIIGGIKIKAGSQVFELNLSSQIDEFRKRLLESAKKSGESDFIRDLEKQVQEFQPGSSMSEIGEVKSVQDGIVTVTGLSSVMALEVVEFASGIKGMVLNLEEDLVGIIVLGDFKQIKQGENVKGTGEIISVPVGENLLGRVVNALGESVDGLGDIERKEISPVEKLAPGVMTRTPVNQPLQTGIKSIDALIPIGRGQRELILGDRQTGKTALAIDTIINQHDQDVICIYVAIGQKDSKIARTVSKLKETGAMDYTIVVKAGASEPSPMLYLSPYTGVTMAEYFAAKGKDVLVIYDDLSKHAVAYREMSLLLRRPPGREAYPGDVFYLHSRLLERAVNLTEEHGGGSITALPIIETQGGDNSAYIPTNVISITDGQIYLETDLFYKGIKPAVNVGASVSRVGSAAQIKSMKKSAGSMKLQLAQFRDLEAFAQFSSDLDPETKKQIDQGKRVTELLKQKQYQPLGVAEQIITIYSVSRGLLDKYDVSELTELEPALHEHFQNFEEELMDQLKSGKWGDEIESQIKKGVQQFNDRYYSSKKGN